MLDNEHPTVTTPQPDVGRLPRLLVSGAAYAFGLHRLWRSAGHGRGIRPAQVAAFAAGCAALAIALASPLDPLGLRLFSAHMLQHELMTVVAAPRRCCLSSPPCCTPRPWARC